MAGELRDTSRGGTHLRREVLRNVKDLHRKLVIAEFKDRFMKEGGRAFRTTVAVIVPTRRIPTEGLYLGQSVEDSQLDDVQVMVEGTGEHLQPGTGQLIQGPKAGIIPLEVGAQRLHRLM